MVKLCCVPGCNHEAYPGSRYSFHKFPRDQELRDKWVQLVPGKIITKYAVMCSEHFKEDDFAPFSRRKLLKHDVIPSIFPKITDIYQPEKKELICFICKWSVNRVPQRSFYKFPSKDVDKNKWLRSIGESNVQMEEGASVCSIHFEPSCFRDGGVHGNHILKPDATPTLYLNENIVTAEFLSEIEADGKSTQERAEDDDDDMANCSVGLQSDDNTSVSSVTLSTNEKIDTSHLTPQSVTCWIKFETAKSCADECDIQNGDRTNVTESSNNPLASEEAIIEEYNPILEKDSSRINYVSNIESLTLNKLKQRAGGRNRRLLCGSVVKSSESNLQKRKYRTRETKINRRQTEVSQILSAIWAPNVKVRSEPAEDTPASLMVCRICLTLDGKMYHIVDFDLMILYERVTGIQLSPGDSLPKMLCWECVARLKSADRFRDKALRSYQLLTNKVGTDDYLSIKIVKSINRHQYKLQSTLVMENLGVDYMKGIDNMDLVVYDNDVDKTEADVGQVANDASLNDCLENPIPDDVIDNNKIFLKEHILCKNKTRRKVSKEKNFTQKKCKDKSLKQVHVKTDTSLERFKSPTKRGNALIDTTVFTITMLSHEEQIAEIEKRRDTSSYQNAPYQCTECYKGFILKEQYDLHIARHSENFGPCVCPICKRRFMTNRSLRNHLSSCHTQRFSCLQCPFTSMNRCAARRHEKYHAGIKYKCPNCPMEFDYQTAYLNHLRIKHMSSFVCELCGETFINSKRIQLHRKIKHRNADKNVPLEGPHCEECDVRFVSEKAYARHLKLSSIHTRDHDTLRRRPYVRKTSSSKLRNAAQHQDSTKQLQESITCEQCGEVLQNFRTYAKHFLRDHPDKNRTQFSPLRTPWMCDQCGKILPSRTYLKRHSWVHTGEKYYKCDRCDKSFTNKMSLTHHLKVHGELLPTYPCPQCGKQFSSFSNQQRHMFIHTGEKPYKCQVCDKCFSTSSARQAHVKHVHLGEPWPRRVRPRAPATLRRPQD